MSGVFDGLAFGRPEVLGLLYGSPLIVVFYLLRRRARQVDVPFLPFWERVLALHRRKPSMARLLLSLLLQLALFSALVLAAADPYREETAGTVSRTLVILDRTGPAAPFSAEVAIRGEEVARAAALAGEVVVAYWNHGTIRSVAPETDVGSAADAVRKAPPAGGSRDPAVYEAILPGAAPSTRIVLVTPFSVPLTPAFRRTEIAGAGGFGVAPNDRNGGLRDVLVVPEDDRVQLSPEARSLLRVLVAADAETPALDAALFASGVVDAPRSSRAKTSAWRDVARDYDVVILIGRDEESPLPKGRYLLFDASAPGLAVVRTGGVGPARATAKSAAEPWLLNLDLDEWDVRKTSEFTAAEGAVILVDGDRGPLVYRADRNGVSVIGVAPPPTPAASTLPLSAAFPVLVRGALLALGAPEAARRLTVVDPSALADPLPPGVVPAVDRPPLEPPKPPAPSGRPERRPLGAPFLLLFLALLSLEWALFHAGFTD